MSERRVNLSKAAPAVQDALDAFSKQAAAFARESGVSDLLKELVLLRASQLNGCARCVRAHLDRALKAGADADWISQISVWRESQVFDDRERAALELAEALTFIADGGVSDDVYNRVGAVLTEPEYVAITWLVVSINNYNRITLASRFPTPKLQG